MSHLKININKLLEETMAKNLQEIHENDLTYKINSMINERVEKNKYMCFSVKCDSFAETPDGEILFAGTCTEYIFAKQDNFEGMIELQKYRKHFPSASSITFKGRIPHSRVCGDVNV